MKQDPALIKKLETIMAKARQSLILAKEHHAKGLGDEAASKAYYAVFHAIQAALLTKGLAFSKHSGVKEGFNREFIHAGTFPKEFHSIIERLFRDRNIGDYSYDKSVDAEESARDVRDAEKMIKAVADHLKNLYQHDFWGAER
jgi:uncharacterized protein (UPF0332 family)